MITLLEKLAASQNAELERMNKLNYLMEEMSRTTGELLLWVIEYCDKNNIPIWKEEKFRTLIQDSSRILHEIGVDSDYLKNLCKRLLSAEFLQGDSSDKDFTEPKNKQQ